MSDERAGLDPDEPHTPAWFTFLGLGVFLLAGILFLVSSAGDAEDEASGAMPEVAPSVGDEPAE